jgi:SAM-dependent methyltransferase
MKLYSEGAEIIYQMLNDDPYFNYLTEKIFSFVPKIRGKKILDLGCGTGRNTIFAAKNGARAIGVDIERKALKIAGRLAKKEGLGDRVKFVHKDLLKTRMRQFGLFDVCILQEVIEHDKDYGKIIRLAYTSLKPGGTLLLTTPNDPSQWNKLDDYAEHVFRLNIAQVRQALSAFTIKELFTVGFPCQRSVLTLYSFLLTLRHLEHDPHSFRTNNMLTRMFRLLGPVFMKIDNLFTFLPWGTTIVVVAQKAI